MSGRIIYISSVLGFVAMPSRGPYVASKFAIEGLVGTLRLELVIQISSSLQFSQVQLNQNLERTLIWHSSKTLIFLASHYKNQYKLMIKRLKSGKNAKFTLPPEAVLKSTNSCIRVQQSKKLLSSHLSNKTFCFVR